MHTLRDSPRNTTAADEAAVRMLQEKIIEEAIDAYHEQAGIREQNITEDSDTDSIDWYADPQDYADAACSAIVNAIEKYEAERRWLTR